MLTSCPHKYSAERASERVLLVCLPFSQINTVLSGCAYQLPHIYILGGVAYQLLHMDTAGALERGC